MKKSHELNDSHTAFVEMQRTERRNLLVKMQQLELEETDDDRLSSDLDSEMELPQDQTELLDSTFGMAQVFSTFKKHLDSLDPTTDEHKQLLRFLEEDVVGGFKKIDIYDDNGNVTSVIKGWEDLISFQPIVEVTVYVTKVDQQCDKSFVRMMDTSSWNGLFNSRMTADCPLTRCKIDSDSKNDSLSGTMQTLIDDSRRKQNLPVADVKDSSQAIEVKACKTRSADTFDCAKHCSGRFPEGSNCASELPYIFSKQTCERYCQFMDLSNFREDPNPYRCVPKGSLKTLFWEAKQNTHQRSYFADNFCQENCFAKATRGYCDATSKYVREQRENQPKVKQILKSVGNFVRGSSPREEKDSHHHQICDLFCVPDRV